MAKSRNLANTSAIGTTSNVIVVPTGTTAQRTSATAGFIRYNTDLNSLESANGTAWANVGSGAASSGGGGVSWQPVQNTNFISVAGNGYLVNTATGNVIVTLPTSPTFGNFITISDYGNTFGSNNLILYPNGSKIQGNTANVNLTVNGESISLVYTDNNKGWVNYNGFVSNPVGNYSVNYLIVAGGGGAIWGGGGAGGLLTGTTQLTPGTSYSIAIGAGGTGATNGSNSTGLGLTSIGGGFGYNGTAGNGGSGGGTAMISSSGGVAGSGTSGQGNGGGRGVDGISVYTTGGGGGGAGGAGTPSTNGVGATGGTGILFSYTGSYYAGGGTGGSNRNNEGGGPYPGTPGGGGSGTYNGAGTAGASNTGGGSGGGNSASNGGSGIAIITYLGGQRATGGTITSSGGYTIHTFNSSGTFIA